MDNLFEREKPRPITDLNIVPIMDMLVCVIFFLLLSTSFMGYTNLNLPPSSVSVVKADQVGSNVIPLSPRLIGFIRDNRLQLRLEWQGTRPGAQTLRIEPRELTGRAKKVESSIRDLMAAFKTTYPTESTLQLTLAREIPYQIMIAIMDGARTHVPDIVLFSYEEAEARTRE